MARCIIHFAIFTALVGAVAAHAAKVVSLTETQRYVGISHPISRKWQLNDNVCVIKVEKEIACGLVVKSLEKLAVIKVDSRTAKIERGDNVELATIDRKPTAALLHNSLGATKKDIVNFNLSGGLSFGLNYFFPMIHAQALVGHRFSVGIQPLYFRGSSDTDSISAIGAFATANYYHNGSFRGLWGQFGAGLHHLSVSTGDGGESATVPAFLATLGWRGYWDMGFNIGVGGGLQWVFDPDFASFELNSTGIRPLVVLDVGFNF